MLNAPSPMRNGNFAFWLAINCWHIENLNKFNTYQEHSPPENWNSYQSPNLTLPRTPPRKLKFCPESKSALTQNTPPENWNSSQSSNLTLPRTPPQIENSNFLSRVQIWHYPAHPPQKLKTLIFFAESKSDLTQNTPPPPKIENSNFLSRVQIWPYPEHPPENWKL